MKTKDFYNQLKDFLLSENVNIIQDWKIINKKTNKNSSIIYLKNNELNCNLEFKDSNGFLINPKINNSIIHHLQLDKTDHLEIEEDIITLKDNFDTGGGRTFIPEKEGNLKEQVKNLLPEQYKSGIIYQGEFDATKIISAILNWAVIRNKVNFEFPIFVNKNQNSDSRIDADKNIKALIFNYKELMKTVGNKGEIYKWEIVNKYKGYFDFETENFYEKLKKINFTNLIYQFSIPVLQKIAERDIESLKSSFKVLFDESIKLSERLKTFSEQTKAAYHLIEPDKSHSQDERAMSDYLTVKYPEKYTFYMNTLYEKYCNYIGIQPKAKTFEKYPHYLELINNLINNYLKNDKELISLKNNFLSTDSFPDTNLLILAQDIIYQFIGSAENESLKKQINTFTGNHKLFDFFDLLKLMISKLQIANEDTRLSLSLRDDKPKMLSATINNRYVIRYRKLNEDKSCTDELCIILLNSNLQKYIQNAGFLKSENFDPFKGEIESPKFVYFNFNKLNINDDFINDWLEAVVYELNRAKSSSFRKGHNRYYYFASINTDFLKSLINNESNAYYQIKELNQMKQIPNLILYGPPGTGKTYSTIDIAANIIANGNYDMLDLGNHKINFQTFNNHLHERIHFLTFHQNYSYEEFVGGLRPDENTDTINFKWKSGIFLNACAYAFKISENNEFSGKIEEKHIEEFLNFCENQKEVATVFLNAPKVVLIIDEINRANISRVFGELITLIEDDKRIGGEHQLILSLPNGRKFGVPANLVIIGTMNTADKSIALLDIALRRRFEFVQMPVKESIKKGEIELIQEIEFLKRINSKIEEKKQSQDFNIGHSYFIKKEDAEFSIDKVMNNKIIPLLYEYFMGDKKEVIDLLKDFCNLENDKENSFAMLKFKSIKTNGEAN